MQARIILQQYRLGRERKSRTFRNSCFLISTTISTQLTEQSKMLSNTQTARSLRSCICQLSRMQVTAPQQPSRQASTSSSSSSSSSAKPGWLARIRAGAQKGAVDRRPPPARVEREMQKMDIEQGNGSLFERALAEAEVEEKEGKTSGQAFSRTKLWTEVSTGQAGA